MTAFFRKRKKNKIKEKRGFSLAEMLVAVLIMAFAGMIVMGGIAVATRVFQDMMLRSQTQMVMKEYMSELQAGFRSADLASDLQMDDSGTDGEGNPKYDNPVFTHSGMNYVGYYAVLSDDPTSEFGTIIFQLIEYDIENNTADKTDELESVQLIGTKLSDDFPAKVEYRYNATTKMFEGTLTVKSNGILSSGEPIELTAPINISPVG